MDIVFMGTPDFAVGALEALVAAGHNIKAVVTQPDKARGRGKEVQFPPVKECALKYQIPVLQPAKIKTPEAVAELKNYKADVFVVAAFGQILSEEILNMPKFGCLNIHASLLPKYRGAAPIQWSIIDGEEYTGITIMQMEKGLDTGDILLQKKYRILPDETGESLFDRLCVMGAELIVEALPLLEAGKLSPIKQKEEEASYAKMLTKALGKMDFSTSAVELERLVRGLNSWPSAYTYYNKKQLKIWKASVLSMEQLKEGEGRILIDKAESALLPGTVVAVDKEGIYIYTKEGILGVYEVQLEGKKRMAVKDFLLGYSVKPGEILG